MRKRILAMFLAVVMLIGMLPMQVFATDEQTAEPETPVVETIETQTPETQTPPVETEAPTEATQPVTEATEPPTEATRAPTEATEPQQTEPTAPVPGISLMDIGDPADPVEADPIEVTMTFAAHGALVPAKDGTLMVNKSVTVTDLNADGELSWDEALVAAHTAYCPAGAGGYVTENGSYGLFVTTLWGEAITNNLFFTNDEPISINVGEAYIGNGDHLYAATLFDPEGLKYNDWYTFFDQTKLEVEAGQEFTLTLKGDAGSGMEFTAAPVAGAAIGTQSGSTFTALDKVTDASGQVTLSFTKPGVYCVTASGNVVIPATDTSSEKTVPVIPAACVVTVTGEYAAHTVTLPESPVGYQVQPWAGSATTVYDGDSFRFKVEILDGYIKSGAFQVKTGETVLTADESGVYTIENITSDVAITVEGVVAGKYLVTLPAQPVGYTVTPEEGSSTVIAEEGGSFSFKVDCTTGYVRGADFKVKANDVELTPDENGVYTVANITADVTITVEGVEESQAVTILAPENSTVVIGTWNDYLYTFADPTDTVPNEDGTASYIFDPLTGSGTAFLRVQNPQGVTYWDFSETLRTAGTTITVTASDLFIDDSSFSSDTVYHNFEKQAVDVADVFLAANAKNYINLSTGGDYELNVLRQWQCTAGDLGGVVSLPDVHYQVIGLNGSGSDVITVTPDEHNSSLATITANHSGTAAVLVTYDAMYSTKPYNGKDGRHSAIWPENTGVLVVSVDADGTGIDTNMTLNEGRKNWDRHEKLSGYAIDAEQDVLYYVGSTGASYTFTPPTGSTVSVARSTVGSSMSFGSFVPVSANADGSVTITGLTTGSHIVKVEVNGTAAYQVLKAKQTSYTIAHADGSAVSAANPAVPGETVTISFGSLYNPVNKLLRVYNTNCNIACLGQDGTLFAGPNGNGADSPSDWTYCYGVYNFASNSALHKVDITIPADWNETTYLLSGYLAVQGYGSAPGAHRNVSYVTGFDKPSGLAGDTFAVMGSLPQITLAVQPPVPATGITLDRTEIQLDQGLRTRLTATTQPVNATDAVVWSSSDETVATVDSNGLVLTMGAGTATITATAGTASADCVVHVSAYENTPIQLKRGTVGGYTYFDISGLTIYGADQLSCVEGANDRIYTVEVGGRCQDSLHIVLKAEVVGYTNKYFWCNGAVSESPAHTYPSEDGITYIYETDVTPVWDENGQMVLNVGLGSSTKITGSKSFAITLQKVDTHVVELPAVPEGYTVTPAEGFRTAVKNGESFRFRVDILEDYQKGTKFAVKAGETQLTETDGIYTIENITSDVTVTVEGVIGQTEIALQEETLELCPGDTARLTALVTPEDAPDKTVTWTSSNPEIAAVDETGLVTAVTHGETVITATAANGKTAQCALTVKNEYKITFYATDPKITGITDTFTKDVLKIQPLSANTKWQKSGLNAAIQIPYNSKGMKITCGGYLIKSIAMRTTAGTANANVAINGTPGEGVGVQYTYPVNSEKAVITFLNGKSSLNFRDKVIVTYELAPLHDVILPTGSDTYTVTPGADTFPQVRDGGSYNFTVAIAEGYCQGSGFAVRVNGEVLTPDENGVYTVANVTEDLTITVEGVVPRIKLSQIAEMVAGTSVQLSVTEAEEKVKDILWELDENDAAFAAISTSGKLTAKDVPAQQTITVTATRKSTGAVDTMTVTIYPRTTYVDILEGNTIVTGQTLTRSTGSTLNLAAALYPDGVMDSVTWKTSSAKIAAVDNGVVTGTGKGTVTITATANDGSKKSASLKIKFADLAKSVTIGEHETELRSGKSMVLTAVTDPVKPDTAGVAWTLKDAADKAYVSLSAGGKLTAKTVYDVHEVTVVAASKDGAASDETTVAIRPKADGILILKSGDWNVTKTTQTLDLSSGTYALSAAILGGDAENVTWKSSNSRIVSLSDAEGTDVTLNLLRSGSATITAAAENGSKASVTIKVTTKVAGIAIVDASGSTDITVASGKSVKLKAVVTPSNAAKKSVTWSVAPEDAAYAKVNFLGTLTASKNLMAARDVTVYATANDGSGIAAQQTVTIQPIATGVQIYSGSRALGGTALTVDRMTADTLDLSAKVYPANAEQGVTWTSSNARVASVDANGLVTFWKAGSVTITAAANDGSGKKTTVKLTVVTSVTDMGLDDVVLSGGKSVNLAKLLVIEPSDATNKKVTWSMTGDTDFATLSASGTLKARKVEEVKTVAVTATAADGYGASATCEVTLYPAATAVVLEVDGEDVSGKTVELLPGDSLQLTAVSMPLDAYQDWTWKSSGEKLAQVDEDGVVTAAEDAAGRTVTITCTAADGSGRKQTVKIRIVNEG